MPTKVFVQDANRWRPARGSESFCVWDLEVLWYEREAYVRTVLGDDPTGGPDRYVGQRLNAPRTNP